jgi:hypothetical protein
MQASIPGISLDIAQPSEQEGNDGPRDAGENEPQVSSEADGQENTPSHPPRTFKKGGKYAGRRKSSQGNEKRGANASVSLNITCLEAALFSCLRIVRYFISYRMEYRRLKAQQHHQRPQPHWVKLGHDPLSLNSPCSQLIAIALSRS